MIYIMMHQNDPVAEIDVRNENESSQYILIRDEINPNKLPFQVKSTRQEFRDRVLQTWMERRIIPKNRYGIGRLYLELGSGNRLKNSLESYGMNLTDNYWFKKKDSYEKWADINFYQHKFSYDVGNFMLMANDKITDRVSPDLTTNGKLRKAWRQIKGNTYLIKAASGNDGMEPFNEVAACELMLRFKTLPVVKYKLDNINGNFVSICQNFLSPGQEFVPAGDIYSTAKKDKILLPDQHLKSRCKYYHIPGAVDFIDKMRLFDFIIGNQDRNLGNFGFIRDVKTDKFIGAAPLFDNASSFWWNKKEFEERDEDVKNSIKEIKIKHPIDITFEKIDGVEYLLSNIYEKSGNIDNLPMMSKMLEKRINVGYEYIESEKHKAINRQKFEERE